MAEALYGLGVECKDGPPLASVDRLHRLVPSDVAAVVRRFRMLGQTFGAEAFVRVLREAAILKDGGAAERTGFQPG